jgi:hypothetical protein
VLGGRMAEDLWEIKKSKIEGSGVFAKKDFGSDQIIDVALVRVKDSNKRIFERNVLGLYLNHNGPANAYLETIGDDFYLIAFSFIKEGEEITVNYETYQKRIQQEQEVLGKEVLVI